MKNTIAFFAGVSTFVLIILGFKKILTSGNELQVVDYFLLAFGAFIITVLTGYNKRD
jgi:hypothetical protein